MADLETYLKVKHENEMRAAGYILYASKTLKDHPYLQLGHVHDVWCYNVQKEWRKPKPAEQVKGEKS